MLVIGEVLLLLCDGKQLEQNVTNIGVFYFIRDSDNKLQECHCNTFHSLKKRGFIKVVKRVGESPSYTGRPLNMSNYYAITPDGMKYFKKFLDKR